MATDQSCLIDPEEAIMALDEMLTALRRDLERDYGVEATAYLMDRPRGGWDSLVTNETLDLKLEAFGAELRGELTEIRAELRGELTEVRAELRGEIAGVRNEMAGLRADLSEQLSRQTWRLATLVVAAQGIVVGALAAIRFA